MQTVAKKLGVRVLTASEVWNFDVDAPSLTLKDGSTFKGDLIVAADGERTNPRDSSRPRSDRRLSKGLIRLLAKRYWMASKVFHLEQDSRLTGQP